MRTEGKLADNTANVGASLDEALEPRGKGATAIKAILKHGSYGLKLRGRLVKTISLDETNDKRAEQHLR